MTHAPFLLVDAGNSRIKWALADASGRSLAAGVFAHGGAGSERDSGMSTDPGWSSLPGPPASAWISNVAGAAIAAHIDTLIEHAWPGLPRTTIGARARQCGVANCYREPARLGSDRWAAMIGAHAAFAGEDLLIATLGTATTLEALKRDGTFTGGLIAPGLSLMMRSLGEHTAQLPTLTADPARTIGGDVSAHRWFATDTPRAISAGSLLAQVGLVERAWQELSQAWGTPVRLVLSGGAADALAHALSVPHTRHDSLVLTGLALIAVEGADLPDAVR